MKNEKLEGWKRDDSVSVKLIEGRVGNKDTHSGWNCMSHIKKKMSQVFRLSCPQGTTNFTLNTSGTFISLETTIKTCT
jgi:hypothetical protein